MRPSAFRRTAFSCCTVVLIEILCDEIAAFSLVEQLLLPHEQILSSFSTSVSSQVWNQPCGPRSCAASSLHRCGSLPDMQVASPPLLL